MIVVFLEKTFIQFLRCEDLLCVWLLATKMKDTGPSPQGTHRGAYPHRQALVRAITLSICVP